MLDALISEVLVPVSDQLRSEVVSLVDQENELLLTLTHFTDVLLQVG